MTMFPSQKTASDWSRMALDIKAWGRELGFQQIGIADTRLEEHETRLRHWLNAGHHGEMAYMANHGTKRSRPDELVPATQRQCRPVDIFRIGAVRRIEF